MLSRRPLFASSVAPMARRWEFYLRFSEVPQMPQLTPKARHDIGVIPQGDSSILPGPLVCEWVVGGLSRSMATTTQLKNAKDLSREAPRSPRVRIGGYVLMARMVDKGRATINGTNGEYHFDCPLDNMLFSFKSVKGEEVRPLLASGASDGEILAWFNSHGSPKTDAEIKAWSLATEAARPYEDPEKREWFVGECEKVGLDPVRSTLFDYLDADDQQSFRK
jgi:hypothetical protein